MQCRTQNQCPGEINRLLISQIHPRSSLSSKLSKHRSRTLTLEPLHRPNYRNIDLADRLWNPFVDQYHSLPKRLRKGFLLPKVQFRHIRSIDCGSFDFVARDPDRVVRAVPNSARNIPSVTKSRGPKSQCDQVGTRVRQSHFVTRFIERLAPPASDNAAVVTKSTKVRSSAVCSNSRSVSVENDGALERRQYGGHVTE